MGGKLDEKFMKANSWCGNRSADTFIIRSFEALQVKCLKAAFVQEAAMMMEKKNMKYKVATENFKYDAIFLI